MGILLSDFCVCWDYFLLICLVVVVFLFWGLDAFLCHNNPFRTSSSSPLRTTNNPHYLRKWSSIARLETRTKESNMYASIRTIKSPMRNESEGGSFFVIYFTIIFPPR